MPDLSTLRLKIVPLDRILLHEAHDARRVERILGAMRQDGCLRNPIMVTEHQGRYVQLDGATRAIALLQMEIPHIVVQVVSYQDPEVSLNSWNHILIDYPSEDLCVRMAEIPRVHCTPIEPELIEPILAARLASAGAPAETQEPTQIGRASEGNGDAARSVSVTGHPLLGILGRERDALLLSSEGGREEQIEQMSQAAAIYRHKAEVRRTAESNLSELLNRHPDLSSVVVFPPLLPEDVFHCATGTTKLPMGITRHLVGGRALGLDVPLEILAADKPLEDKNAWLEEMVLERIRKHKVRVYQEPVIIFDD